MGWWSVLSLALLLSLAGACSDDGGGSDPGDLGEIDLGDVSPDTDAEVSGDPAGEVDAGPGGPVIAMDFTRADGFYAAPFPDDSRLVEGHVVAADFPNPDNIAFARRIVSLIDGQADGFGVSSGIFFALSEPIALPELSVADTVAEDAVLSLVSVDPAAPDYGRRYPVTVSFAVDGGPFGAPNLLSAVPVQGFPLRERQAYAAYVRRDLPAGEPLSTPPALVQLRAGERPAGLQEAAFARYRDALAALESFGIDTAELAGLAVFTTWGPSEELLAVRDQLLDDPLPELTAPLLLNEVFDAFCVYESTLPMPTYQTGTPPFSVSGGGWVFEAGRAVRQGFEESNIVVTVPRQPPPEAGYPVVVFVRTGGGGDRPLVDRGQRGVAGGPSLEPGTGPAQFFAWGGFAGLTIDGPHGGLRNVTGGDEQFLMFNVTNPLALRDNIRQAALETALAAHLVGELTLDASDCPGVETTVGLDESHIALMGHSMGATVMVPAAAAEPGFGALVLSGAGGSYIENVVYKLSPFPVRPFAETILQYTASGRELHEHDPILSLLQYAGEPSDPPIYGRLVTSEPRPGAGPRHVLMLQGIVDTYLLPPMANATSLSLGLDLAGPEYAIDDEDLPPFTPLTALLPFAERAPIALPASGNRTVAGTDVTAVVLQHREDGVEDGHEVVFQTAAPKRQYRCFLEGFAADEVPVVPSAGEADAPCE